MMHAFLAGLLVIVAFIVMVINSQWAVKNNLPEGVQNAGATLAAVNFIGVLYLSWCMYQHGMDKTAVL